MSNSGVVFSGFEEHMLCIELCKCVADLCMKLYMLPSCWVWCTFVDVSYYTTLHYTALHCTPLHSTPLHYTTLHYTAAHNTTAHHTTLHFMSLHSLHHTTTTTATTLRYTTLRYTTLITLPYSYNSTTLQLQLQLRYNKLHPAVVGEVTTATIASAPNSTTPTTFRSINGFALPSMHLNNSPLL